MIGAVPTSTFDTSAHNRLIDDDRSRSEGVLRTVNSQLWFRFAGLTIEELSACPTPRRELLFAACRKLQDGPSECLLPSSLLTEALVSAYHQNPISFKWKEVNVRWGMCEAAIREPNASTFALLVLIVAAIVALAWTLQRIVRTRARAASEPMLAAHGS